MVHESDYWGERFQVILLQNLRRILLKKTLSESFAKPLAVRMMVSNAKFEVEEFDGMNNFGMWQCEVMGVLVQQELDITFEDKHEGMSDKD